MGQTIHHTFAQWLRGQLRESGWMVSDFAQRVGVRPSAVYRWTAGQRIPTDGQVERIAEVLGIDPQVIWAELAQDGIRPIGVVPKARPDRPPVDALPPEDRPFARWIREQLAERGWTTGQLARQIGLDVVTVRAWASGLRTPASVQFIGIARAFDVDAEFVSQKTQE